MDLVNQFLSDFNTVADWVLSLGRNFFPTIYGGNSNVLNYRSMLFILAALPAIIGFSVEIFFSFLLSARARRLVIFAPWRWHSYGELKSFRVNEFSFGRFRLNSPRSGKLVSSVYNPRYFKLGLYSIYHPKLFTIRYRFLSMIGLIKRKRDNDELKQNELKDKEINKWYAELWEARKARDLAMKQKFKEQKQNATDAFLTDPNIWYNGDNKLKLQSRFISNGRITYRYQDSLGRRFDSTLSPGMLRSLLLARLSNIHGKRKR